MPTQFGVSVDDELFDRIEADRDRRDEPTDDDIVSRSQAVTELLALAFAVRDQFGEEDFEIPRGRDERLYVRQAIREAAERERAREREGEGVGE
jgi:hypothetical protein